MRCYKCDAYGEAPCEHAKYDPMINNAQCLHPCVVMAETQRGEMERKLWDAESKLRQYREAVRPIVRNCRAILDALEAESKAMNDPKKEDNE